MGTRMPGQQREHATGDPADLHERTLWQADHFPAPCEGQYEKRKGRQRVVRQLRHHEREDGEDQRSVE